MRYTDFINYPKAVFYTFTLPGSTRSHELICRHISSYREVDPKDPRWQLTRELRILSFLEDFFWAIFKFCRFLITDDTKSFFPVCGPPWTYITGGTLGFPISILSPPKSRCTRAYSFSRHNTAILLYWLDSRSMFGWWITNIWPHFNC